MALEKRLKDLEKAFDRLKESYFKTLEYVNSDYYPFFRDSTVQRFEFTTEILWKTLKEFLHEKEGVECKSPKSCIREFFSTGYVSSEEANILLQMIDDRNLTSHTYHEDVAEKIFKDLAVYLPVIESVLAKFS